MTLNLVWIWTIGFNTQDIKKNQNIRKNNEPQMHLKTSVIQKLHGLSFGSVESYLYKAEKLSSTGMY